MAGSWENALWMPCAVIPIIRAEKRTP